jgi:predicted amidohydrolase
VGRLRKVVVSSIQPKSRDSLDPFQGQTDRVLAHEKMNRNIDMAINLMSKAGEGKPDIICYPEDIQSIAHYGYFLGDIDLFTGLIQTVPGPITERISEVAKKYNMNIVFGIFEKERDCYYNTGVLMNREGKIIGKYRKVQLPAAERWALTRGDDFPVFDTDFGTVGIMICYDIMFPEPARALTLNGAEIIFNPTMGYHTSMQCKNNGLIRTQARALDNFVPIVVSIAGRGSLIIGSDGSVLAESVPNQEDIISATIDLDANLLDMSHQSVLTGISDLKARYILERVPQAYHVIIQTEPPLAKKYIKRGTILKSTIKENWEAFEYIRNRWSKT